MTFQAHPSPAMLEKYRPIATKDNPHPESQCGPIWVEFSKESSMGIKQMRVFAHHIQSHSFHTGIMVTQQALTPSAYKIVAAVHPNILETFMEQDLLVNITHHSLVPKHVVMSATEKKQLLERYRLKESQLPRIQTGDPMAKYLGLRRGQVVKIIRNSQTAGRYATYRWAI
jgi:DNA-directed RNA polymerases I, II, and III subunit RPABC1